MIQKQTLLARPFICGGSELAWSYVCRGAGTQVVVGGNVGSLWGKNQHFPHIIPTYSQQMINILPTTTFDQQRPHKLSYNCPHVHKFTSCYPQQNQHFVNGPINYQLTPFLCHFSSGENAGNMLRWAGCWADVDVTRPPKSLSSAQVQSGENVGRMLRWAGCCEIVNVTRLSLSNLFICSSTEWGVC